MFYVWLCLCLIWYWQVLCMSMSVFDMKLACFMYDCVCVWYEIGMFMCCVWYEIGIFYVYEPTCLVLYLITQHVFDHISSLFNSTPKLTPPIQPLHPPRWSPTCPTLPLSAATAALLPHPMKCWQARPSWPCLRIGRLIWRWMRSRRSTKSASQCHVRSGSEVGKVVLCWYYCICIMYVMYVIEYVCMLVCYVNDVFICSFVRLFHSFSCYIMYSSNM